MLDFHHFLPGGKFAIIFSKFHDICHLKTKSPGLLCHFIHAYQHTSHLNMSRIIFLNVRFPSFSVLVDMGPIEKYRHRCKDDAWKFLGRTDQNSVRKLDFHPWKKKAMLDSHPKLP